MMKRSVILSAAAAAVIAVLFFVFTIGDATRLSVQSSFIPQLSASYFKTLNGYQFYGQKDFNIETYGEILSRSGITSRLNTDFPELKARLITFDRSEDSKLLTVKIITDAREVKDSNAIGKFIEAYFSELLSSMSKGSLSIIKGQKDKIREKMDSLEKELEEDTAKGLHLRFGQFYRKYRVNYGNAPIPGEVMLHGQGYSSSTLILDQLKQVSGDNIKFDDAMAGYLLRLSRYNQSFSDLMRLESFENEASFLSISKISPLYHLGSSVIKGSVKRALIKTLTLAVAIFLIFFTLLYVARKDQ